MPLSREHKVAVAVTEDGRKVADHFGSAPLFLVLTVENGRVVSKEVRANRCKFTGTGTELGCWDVIDQILPDVRVVISAGMGEHAYLGLLRRDVLPLVTRERGLERAIRDYLHDRLMENLELVHGPGRMR